ncbi:MAG TPA: histidine kinase, partial [Anditalea sp.]|nr:histidine kinase [Anditalea sp.]
QLQPHFLFNSLNSINALMISRPEKAREMVFQLSDFLRGTIRKETEQLVDFSEELHTLKLYLDIEKVRFGHRLHVEVNADQNTFGLQLPALLLQPLVENAVKFGLYGMLGEVSISINAMLQSRNLHIIISNPFDPTDTPPPGSGFGLQAVKRRLYLVFGRHDLINISKTNDIFRVTINIPQLK